MRVTFTTLLIILLATTAAFAGGNLKEQLTRPDGGPDSDIKGFIKVKPAAGAELFQVKIRKADRKAAYGLFIQDAADSADYEKFGVILTKKSGTGKWKVNGKKGDEFPFFGDRVADLAGRRVEVRDADGDVVLFAIVPGDRPTDKPGDTPPTDKPDETDTPVRDGPRLRILVTDAPFPFESVKSAIVVVRRVEIRPVDGPFETLIEWANGRELDLVNLKNGVMNILYAGDPEPGDYDALRIIVTAKEITIEDGGVEKTFTEFKVPSGDKTGIKVYMKPVVDVVTDLTRDVILDVNLAKSFIVQGNPKTPAGIKGFHFKPVVQAVNRTVAGTLTFRVMSDNGTPDDRTDDFYLNGAGYQVVDTTAEPPKTVASGSTGTDPDDREIQGYAFHPGILGGSYRLDVAYRDHDTHQQRLNIVAGNLSDEGTIVLAATAAYVKGTVTTEIDTKDGDTLTFAVPDATVEGTLRGDSAASARDTTSTVGGYALTDLTFGTYVVKVTKTGYKDGTGNSPAFVPGDTTASDLDFVLEPETADVTGTVTDSSGNAVSGATVRAIIVYAGNDEIIAETTTDVNGDYTLEGLPTADYEITAEITVSDTTSTGSDSLEHVGPTASTVDLTVEEGAE
jgi:hypothetical protein